eukprot:12643534-Alexandrium_andersonii.AAC.1
MAAAATCGSAAARAGGRPEAGSGSVGRRRRGGSARGARHGQGQPGSAEASGQATQRLAAQHGNT